MHRRAFLKGIVLSAAATQSAAQEASFPSPTIKSRVKSDRSVFDFQGSSFRAKLQNALNAAVEDGIRIKLPSASELDIDAQIEIKATDAIRISLSGEGMASTVVRCDGVGISLTGGAGSEFSFDGISFIPQKSGQGTALKLEWTDATVGKGFAIEDVGFGANGVDVKNFFARGLEVRNKGNGQVVGCWFNGQSSEDPQGEGIVLSSANDVIVSNTHMYNLAYGCRSDGATSLEGFKLHSCYLVRVGHGVYFSASPIGLPYIEVALSHINSCYEGIHLEGYSQANIVDNLMYGRIDINQNAEQVDIFIKNCPAITIARNKFFSGMDKSKVTKTAIRAVGSIRNSEISDNLAGDRTVFLDIEDDGVNGAQDILISKNRAARDLQGRLTVVEMYRLSDSPLHRRISWDGVGDEFWTYAQIESQTPLAPRKWTIVPFTPISALTPSLALKAGQIPGEMVVPAGITHATISVKIRIVSAGNSTTFCSALLLCDTGGGFSEVTHTSSTGTDCTLAINANLTQLNAGSRLRVEAFQNEGNSASVSNQVSETTFAFYPTP